MNSKDDKTTPASERELLEIKQKLNEASKRIPADLFLRATAIKQIYSSRMTFDTFFNDQVRKDTALLISDLMQEIWDSKKNLRKADAKQAANALHDKPGGSRDKKAQIREIWATGKYSSRDICAEQECCALGMSFSAARKALRNTPDPA